VAEAWRNLIAVGATPLAITDNMNFGNPEKPEIMGQFAGCIEGMREACLALDFPVVSGNVSLYNETNGKAILPTPMIGGVGRIDDLDFFASIDFRRGGETIVLIGETKGHLGHSLYLRDLLGRADGSPPPVDLVAERKAGDFVRGLIESGAIATCHDISDGGLLVALAEMALASNIGAEIAPPPTLPSPLHAWLFGEDQGRYLIAANNPDEVVAAAKAAGVAAFVLGRTGGNALTVAGSGTISLQDLKDAHEGWLPRYMASPDALTQI
jgi:phosphoribosylformylglycinamidine synthase